MSGRVLVDGGTIGAEVGGSGAGAGGGAGPTLKRLYAPQPVSVRLGPERAPVAVRLGPERPPVEVASVREQWVVEDRWWEPGELRRAYFELALADGRVAVVYRCAVSDRWYRQRA